MQSNYDNVISPDFNDPLQYFDSTPPTSRTTPPIYADDPWSTIPEGSFDFDNTSSSYIVEQHITHNNHFIGDSSEQRNTVFGSELTSFNVLCL